MRTVRAGEVILDGAETVQVLGGDAGVAHALELLDAAERAAGGPLVDEAERFRLRRLAAGEREHDGHWHPLLAQDDGRPTGYAGVLIEKGRATGDLAVDRRGAHPPRTTRHLFIGIETVAARHDADRLEVWIRHATSEDVDAARACGYEVVRRLAVLGRGLDDPAPGPDLPAGVEVRAYRPGDDDAAVVSVLGSAYAGTPDADWDERQLRQRRAYDWFDPADVLVAERDGAILGLHWTKRRGGGVGEVYNLAIHPRAQGSGLGRALLRAGLAHLADRGCREVVLWVDENNDAAVRLYESEGFERRWHDLAFAITPRRQPPTAS